MLFFIQTFPNISTLIWRKISCSFKISMAIKGKIRFSPLIMYLMLTRRNNKFTSLLELSLSIKSFRATMAPFLPMARPVRARPTLWWAISSLSRIVESFPGASRKSSLKLSPRLKKNSLFSALLSNFTIKNSEIFSTLMKNPNLRCESHQNGVSLSRISRSSPSPQKMSSKSI